MFLKERIADKSRVGRVQTIRIHKRIDDIDYLGTGVCDTYLYHWSTNIYKHELNTYWGPN